ncbi:hypothetical protein AMJ57_04840 [Parcubacteria bacterium SG8_24]|nr:MAG: hypothetical protein AMJ57_04840 [Parcubacteria bacterium SG8_24]
MGYLLTRHSLQIRLIAYVLMAAAVFSAWSGAVRAETVMDSTEARERLAEIYAKRGDLQQFFRPADWRAVPARETTGISDLQDWARQYGYREYPALLAWYAPTREVTAVASSPRALEERSAELYPTPQPGVVFDPASVSASSVLVIDVPTRRVLISHNVDAPHPLASVTKLMTSLVALDRSIPPSRPCRLTADDEVGGARLRVLTGSQLSFEDLMYATLVGSANNAAHAVARESGPDIVSFVTEMNRKADFFGLRNTVFTDPTGLDVTNTSTAREAAALALEAFESATIRRMTSTAQRDLDIGGTAHRITNTNDLLTDPDNGLFVLGGKTGYLHESKWNLVVKMMDGRNKPLLVVVFGAESQDQLFRDAAAAARQAWDSHRWGL